MKTATLIEDGFPDEGWPEDSILVKLSPPYRRKTRRWAIAQSGYEFIRESHSLAIVICEGDDDYAVYGAELLGGGWRNRGELKYMPADSAESILAAMGYTYVEPVKPKRYHVPMW